MDVHIASLLKGGTIARRYLRNFSGLVLRALDAGSSFIVTRSGAPVGELKPYRQQVFVSKGAVLAMFRHAPSIDARRFREDIDVFADQDITPLG